ncbi:Uncharacterised protein [Serratia fonticola]|uniref:Uncharacterized protein n=1 Tax=Serratia fonticola TaxID=47917 RepID=A0A4U9VT05_SERFO|nr:Uncharacterised protein [Serratia fonticola]
MRYDPVSQTFVEDDYRLQDHLDFKRQHADIKLSKVARSAQRNEKMRICMPYSTVEEAQYFLKTLCDPNANQSWKDAMFSCTDPMSSFAGNIAESLSVGRIAMELRGFGVHGNRIRGEEWQSLHPFVGIPLVSEGILNATPLPD